MEKKSCLKILILLFIPVFVTAQQPDKPITLNNLCLMQATISPGYMFYHGGLSNSYFHATLEWCFDKRTSIRADGSYFFTTQGEYKPFMKNHSLLLGAFYHFPKNKRDYYFGLQPGAACVQQTSYTYGTTDVLNPKLKVAPILTTTIGVNYFFWKYMNLFLGIKYIHGTHIPDYGESIPLDELRISGGLGFHWQKK